SFGTHASGQVEPRSAVTPDVGALYGATGLSGGIRRVPVPDRPVVNDQGARRTAGQYLPFLVGIVVVHEAGWHAGPIVRARGEPGGPVVGPKLVDHKDETEHRPPALVRPGVHVKVPGLRT